MNSEANEACDDSNANNNDDCLTTCVVARCGDGFIFNTNGGAETCDGDGVGVGGQTALCDSDCTESQCGDGTVNADAGEMCDDGNSDDSDSCPDMNGTCQDATCFDQFTFSVANGGTETDVDCGGGCLACPDTLLLSEFVVSPSSAEFIEIFNPGSAVVNLAHVYLADFSTYYLIADAGPSPSTSDFLLRFPLGSVIAPNERIVIALSSATSFQTTYGSFPRFRSRRRGHER